MLRKRSLILLFGLIAYTPHFLQAQCNDPELPGTDCFSAPLLCASDLAGYCSTTPDFLNPIAPPPYCAGADNNVQWISFIAGTTMMQLAITYGNCQGTPNGAGIQAQVFGNTSVDCNNNEFFAVSNCYESFGIGQGVAVLNIGPLVPGDVYYLIVDGWNGDVCDWSVEVTAGEAGDPPVDIQSTALDACPDDVDPGNPQAGCEQVCAYSTVTYSVPDFPLINWEIEGAESYVVDGNSVTVEWGPAGSGFVSATPEDSGGGSGLTGLYCGIKEAKDSAVTIFTYFNLLDSPPPYMIDYLDSEDNKLIPSDFSTGTAYYSSWTFPDTVEEVVVNIMDQDSNLVESCAIDLQLAGLILGGSCFDDSEVSITPPCGGCNGSISLPEGNAYQWSNGNSGPELTNLCPGVYSVSWVSFGPCFGLRDFLLLDCGANTCGSEGFLCVDIVDNPSARFSTLPSANGDTLEICEGQPLFLENLSAGAESYVWDFGDGGSSSLVEPEHSYVQPGLYELRLIARNACFCADSTNLWVRVLEAQSPEIKCTGTLCENSSATYSTDIDCGVFLWTISDNGTITAGGDPSDNFVDVDWGEGPVGTVSLAVENCNGGGNVCFAPTVEQIGLISDAAQIKGPEKVCQGERAVYSLFPYHGTDFSWTTSAFGFILEGQGSNEILVEWTDEFLPTEPQWVAVEFENCYLGCGGRDTIWVDIRQNFRMLGPIEVCENTSSVFRATEQDAIPVFCDWTVFGPDGQELSFFSNTESITVDWNQGPGRYRIEAAIVDEDLYCNEVVRLFPEVNPEPALPDGIEGPLQICPGNLYTYKANALEPGSNFEWLVVNGVDTLEKSGLQVTVEWGNSLPRKLLLRRINTEGLPCVSEFIEQTVDTLPLPALDGPSDVCPEEEAIYTATDYPLENGRYQWSIQPAGMGSILSGKDSSAIRVLWHGAGEATVSLQLCGYSVDQNVTIYPLPEPVVDAPEGLCPGEQETVTTTESFSEYRWLTENGQLLSIAPTVLLDAGYYQLQVTDDQGCSGDTLFQIQSIAVPQIVIDAPIYPALCPGGAGVTLYASGSESDLSYEWYQDGAATGDDDSTFQATQLGSYFVEVTDANGCVTNSNTLVILDCEAVGGTCNNGVCSINIPPNPGCPANGSLDFEIAPTSDCHTRQYINTSINHIPGSLQWNFGDPSSGPSNTSTQENPSHAFAGGLGFYTISLEGLVQAVGGGVCERRVIANDTISVEADFEAPPGCAGQEIAFTDLSTFLPFDSITQWSWNFGDPGSGAANSSSLREPTHIYEQAGIYNVTLTVAGANGCQTSSTREVEVFEPPEISFNTQGPGCENTAYAFEADLGSEVASITWDFGDPGSGGANMATRANTFHVFDSVGVYTVKLTGTSIYGCMDSFFSTLNIVENMLEGQIAVDPSAVICEGDTTSLTASPGGISWTWSDGQGAFSIPVSSEDVYTVAVTDENGCTYRPPAQVVEVIKAPEDEIRAVEYNENGLPAVYFYNQLSICEGDDLYLEMVGYGNYSYEWSSGQVDTAVSFTEDRGNQLSPGNYEFYVTITDNASGCTSVEGPMLITVNAAPLQAALGSDPEAPICEGTQTQIFLVQPDPGLSYLWNTGATGDSIMAVTEGSYFAIAVDSFGCRTHSDTVTILQGPDIRKIPDGCHTACSKDTLCLPDLQNVVALQWYLNGVPLPPPEGVSPAPILTQSGEYTVEMQNDNGCTAVSDPFTLFLTPGFGDISGLIYDDVNDNGQVDPTDTLMSGIQVILCLDELPVDSTLSDSSGMYLFAGVGEGNYEVKIDTASLPSHYQTTIGLWAAEIEGCEDLSEGQGLIDLNCPPIFDTLTLEACQGATVEFLGVSLSPGADTVFTLTTADNCDSLLSVRVEPLAPSLTSINLSACQGDSVLSNGVWIPAGGNEVFTYTNASGCDSTLLVTVGAIPADTTSLVLAACGGETVLYAGQELSAGDTAAFSFTGSNGCDSVVVVNVTGTQADTSALSFQVCAGEFVLFEGQEVLPGDTAEFLYTGSDGCDSLVLVSVAAFPAIQADLAALQPACEGQADGSFEVMAAPDAAGPLQYSLGGQTYQPGAAFVDLPAGSYVAYVEDINGCVDSLEVILPEIAGLQLGVLSYPIGCDNATATLEPVVLTGAEGEVSFEWENGSTDAVLQVDAPGVYSVLVSNACEELELEVAVVNAADSLEEFFFVPNAFSPNEDGHNDEWVIAHPPFVQVLSFELRVYSRWGEELFVSRSLDDSWDGNRPEYMNPGVYVWQLWAEVIDCRGERRRVYRKGDVTLVR